MLMHIQIAHCLLREQSLKGEPNCRGKGGDRAKEIEINFGYGRHANANENGNDGTIDLSRLPLAPDQTAK